jgi:hypothetical protein
MEAARRAEKELDAEIVVIKKTSKEYSQEKDSPACPSVMVNGRMISPSFALIGPNVVTYEDIKAAIASSRGSEAS